MQDRLTGLRQESRERCLPLEETYYPELAKDEDARAWYHGLKEMVLANGIVIRKQSKANGSVRYHYH